MTRTHRITPVLILAAMCACSNHTELHKAQTSAYDAEFAVVYGEAMNAVQKLYPNFNEDATKGRIETSWHQVQYASQTDGDASSRGMGIGNPMGGGGTSSVSPSGATGQGATGSALQRNSMQSLTQKFYVRFEVAVVGGRPWRVHVTGHAAEWTPGNAVPTELHGGNKPSWLDGRTNELMIAIYQRLESVAIPVKMDEEHHDDGVRPVDTSLFGAVPDAAKKAAAAVETAIEQRDYGALRDATADDVVWSLGADPGADAALAMWQADPSTLDTLISSMKSGCAGDDKKVVCPAAAAADGYLGWRVVLEPRGSAWKLTSFLKVE